MIQYGMAAFVPRGSQYIRMNEENLLLADRVLLERGGLAYDLTTKRFDEIYRCLNNPQSAWQIAAEKDGLVLYKRKGKQPDKQLNFNHFP